MDGRRLDGWIQSLVLPGERRHGPAMHIVWCEYVLTWYAAWLLSLGAVPLVSFGKGANLAHCMNVMLHLTRLETRTKESNTCANLWVIFGVQ